MKYLVYIVEDNPKTGVEYLNALRKSDSFDAELFTTAEEANAAAAKRAPHILLADIRLDQAAGTEYEDATKYLQKIRTGETSFDLRIPVVLFTGALPELVLEPCKRAVAQRANALLVKDKDIKPETAAEVLKHVLDEIRERDEVTQRLLDELRENDALLSALEIVKAQSDKETLVMVAADAGGSQVLTFDEVMRHVQKNDEFARNFRAGLYAIALTLVQGTQQPKK